MLAVIIIYVAILVLMVASAWKLFQLAGKPGWASIVPIYNLIVMFEIARKPLWWILMFFIPIVNIVFAFRFHFAFYRAYGKSTGFAIAAIFFGFILMPMMAFSSDTRYVYGDEEVIGGSPALDYGVK